MKSIFTTAVFFVLSSLNTLFATVYTTTSDGNINSNIWSPSVPSSPLADGDEMIINHDITLNIEFKVFGKMTVNSGASLTGVKKLKIGEGSTTGELINNGTIDIHELKVKGDDTVQNLTAPSITNNGTIQTNKLHVGDNSGAGILTNNASGNIIVSGELHLDNILSNIGDMTVNGTFKVHGGTVEGGGSISTDLIELDNNNGRPGTLNNQNICSDFGTSSEPNFKIKGGSSYSSLDEFISNETASSSDHSLDATDFYSCGLNSLGNPLPVDLTHFSAEEINNQQVLISWITESETNSDFFELERSDDGKNFKKIQQVFAAGTTNESQSYSYTDQVTLPVIYYRLRQVDLDGLFEFSEIVVVEMRNLKEGKLRIYPSPAQHEINVLFEGSGSSTIRLYIYNMLGEQLFAQTFEENDQLFHALIDLPKLEDGYYNIVIYNDPYLASSTFYVKK